MNEIPLDVYPEVDKQTLDEYYENNDVVYEEEEEEDT